MWDKDEKEADSTEGDHQNRAATNQGMAGGQVGGQRWRLKPLGVTQVGLLTGDMDTGLVGQLMELMRTGLAGSRMEVWLMELVSDGSLTSGEESDRFQRGARVVNLAAAAVLTGQDSAEPLTVLVSADPSAAGVDPELAGPLMRAGVSSAAAFGSGSRVNRSAAEEPNVEPQTGSGQDAHKEPETSDS